MSASYAAPSKTCPTGSIQKVVSGEGRQMGPPRPVGAPRREPGGRPQWRSNRPRARRARGPRVAWSLETGSIGPVSQIRDFHDTWRIANPWQHQRCRCRAHTNQCRYGTLFCPVRSAIEPGRQGCRQWRARRSEGSYTRHAASANTSRGCIAMRRPNTAKCNEPRQHPGLVELTIRCHERMIP